MDEFTQQQTLVRFQKLPAQLRNVLADPETYDKIALVAKKYDLTRVETGLLAQVVGALMQGFIKPNEFIAEVMDYLTTSHDVAMHIAQDLNRDIFNGVKDVLKDVHNMETKKSGAPIGLVLSPVQNVAVTPPTPVAKPTNQPARPDSPASGPIRSDWGWHGKKNEVTGKIEFKHETVTPDATGKGITLPLTTMAGAAHVGSIFEQKLGGAFTIKGETAEYIGASPTPPSPSAPANPTLHIPHKPIQVPIPPVQVFQQPRGE